MSATWGGHDARPVPRWRILAAVLATVLVLAVMGGRGTDGTATSPDPMTATTERTTP